MKKSIMSIVLLFISALATQSHARTPGEPSSQVSRFDSETSVKTLPLYPGTSINEDPFMSSDYFATMAHALRALGGIARHNQQSFERALSDILKSDERFSHTDCSFGECHSCEYSKNEILQSLIGYAIADQNLQALKTLLSVVDKGLLKGKAIMFDFPPRACSEKPTSSLLSKALFWSFNGNDECTEISYEIIKALINAGAEEDSNATDFWVTNNRKCPNQQLTQKIYQCAKNKICP